MTKNVGELLTVNAEDLIKQYNQMILDLTKNMTFKSQQVSQLATEYSKVATELDELKKYLEKVHPEEFQKLYESEVKNDGTTENANADTGLAEDGNI